MNPNTLLTMPFHHSRQPSPKPSFLGGERTGQGDTIAAAAGKSEHGFLCGWGQHTEHQQSKQAFAQNPSPTSLFLRMDTPTSPPHPVYAEGSPSPPGPPPPPPPPPLPPDPP